MSRTGSISAKERFQQVFWLGFLVVSLAYAWYSFYAPPNEIRWSTTPAEAQALAQVEGKPMVFFLTAKWCSPCRVMKRKVWADEEVTQKINAGFVPVLLDVDDPMAKPVMERYNVSGGSPWTFITDGEGNVLDYRFGAVDKAEFLAMLALVSKEVTGN